MDKYEIAVLSEDYHTKRQRFELLGQRNVAGLTAEERMQVDIEYDIADAEVHEAWCNLFFAKTGMSAT